MISELIKERYSVRSYSDIPVEQEKIDAILEAGRAAPTAKNIQPQFIYVVKSQKSLSKLRGVCRMAFDAPVVFIICADVSEAFVNPFNNRNYAETDTSIVTDHMMLQATELGLGTCWVGWFDPEPIMEALGIPEKHTIMHILPVGYPSEQAAPSPSHGSRKPVTEKAAYL